MTYFNQRQTVIAVADKINYAKNFNESETSLAFTIYDYIEDEAAEVFAEVGNDRYNVGWNDGYEKGRADAKREQQEASAVNEHRRVALDNLAVMYFEATKDKWRKEYEDMMKEEKYPLIPITKMFRNTTGCGLKCAKECIEKIRDEVNNDKALQALREKLTGTPVECNDE